MFRLPRLGVLRTALLLIIVLLIVVAPLALGESGHSGWRLMTSAVFPALMPMMLFVLMLEMTMCRVLMSGQPESERARLRAIIRLEALLTLLMILAWLPFLYRLLG
ncbi:hypothetical protein OAS86_01570 [Gammaproteobacteria bacterium]|nr:hypothetical protein [Gammaproteobacteria bacterium]